MFGMLTELKTKLRGRCVLTGCFTTATTSAPTAQQGDGVAAYSATGVYTVTMPNTGGPVESVFAQIDNGADGDLIVVRAGYVPATGVLTIGVRDISGAGYANSTGLVVSYIVILHGRAD